MVMLGFTVDNARENIRSGRKTTTLRVYDAKRFEQIQRIRKLQLYWKPRTKACELIAEVELYNIRIFKFVHAQDFLGYPLLTEHFEIMAHKDGFNNYDDMLEWFHSHYGDAMYKMDFMLIEWYPPKVV